ncbi:MAG: hypothetical protein R2867_17480 [Caldilineaceae bacterium]
MDYAGAEEARVLGEVHAMLKAHYLPVVTTSGTGHLCGRDGVCPRPPISGRSAPYDLTVTRRPYGEHHAASTVHILIGHAEAGAMRFRDEWRNSRQPRWPLCCAL